MAKPVETQPPTEPTPCLLTTTDDTPQLTRAQQTEYLRLLTLGASPAAACQKVGVSITAVLVTMDQSAAFRKRMDRVPDLLSQNVAASLYQAAMKGSVSAATFYLRKVPPPEWETGESTGKSSVAGHKDTKDISDERLAEFLQAARRSKQRPGDRPDHCDS